MKLKPLIISCLVITGCVFASHAQAAASKAKVSGQLNLNTATMQQIDQLPSVSPKKAQAIVHYRKEKPFKSVDELDNVKGFSPKSIEKLKPYLTIDGPNTLLVEKGAKKTPAKAATPETQKSTKS